MDAIQAAIAKARAARTAALAAEAGPPPALSTPVSAATVAPLRLGEPLPTATLLTGTPADTPAGASMDAPAAPLAAAPEPEPPRATAPATPVVPLPATAAVSAAAVAPAAESGVAFAPAPAPVAADVAQAGPAATAAPSPDATPEETLRQRWQALPPFTPQPKLLARNHVVTAQGGPEAAPFDQMRTRLLQQMRANGWRRVAITSPGPGCGKSTVALNLALSLARQAEQRTVLAELDLRRPSLARMLGLRPPAPPQDFARVLQGRDRFAAQAARIGTNLAFSTCRGPVRNSAELLHSPAAAAALKQIEEDFAPTIFLFDTPPVLLVDDAMAVMGQMDCALIVAAAEGTKIAEIDRCERELASQTNVLGVVLNKCRYMEQDYSYDYYNG